jgi:hypothetical protein
MSLDEIVCIGNAFIFLFIALLFDEQEKGERLCDFEWSM